MTPQRIFVLSLSFIILLSVVPICFPEVPSDSQAPSWWNDNWPYRRKITISGSHPENFQIKIVIPPEIPKIAYPSMRFLENETGGILPYWIEKNEGEYTNVVWVRRLENSDSEIWMYYGNQNAESAENGEDVFLFFDDFGGYRNRKAWGVVNTFGVGWRGEHVTLFDFGDSMTKIEKKPPSSEMSVERVLEFRVRARSAYRGGLVLSGPGNFGGQKEYACIHNISGIRFFSDGEQSPAIVEQGKWYIGQVFLYLNNKIRTRFLFGEDNQNYRQILWVSSEKTNNWNPLTDANNYCDKYNLAVWDSGGTSSYHFDWFFVRRYSSSEPQVSVGSEEVWPGPPPPATLKSPMNGETTGRNPSFEWTPSPITSRQVLQISASQDFTEIIISETLDADRRNYQTLIPLSDGTYYWRLLSVNDNGETPSEVRWFRVDTRPKPSPFNLLSPWNGRTISNRTPKLVWENAKTDGEEISHYEIWIDGINVENTPAGLTEYTTQPLSIGTHSWQVLAVGKSGRKTPSPVFMFEIVDVNVLNQDENGFTFRTGEYIIEYRKSQEYISIYPENSGPSRILRLVPGGGDPYLQVLSPSNVSGVTVENMENAITGKIVGTLSWGQYEVQVILPKDLPRTVNYRLYIRPSSNISQSFFSGVYPEFRYTDNAGSNIDPLLRDYLDGLPNAWSGGLHDEYCRDLNQFIFFGDPTVLKSTFLYYCDFTSLNRFFQYSGNFFTVIDGYTHHSNDVVRQPPGFFRTSKTLPITFGYDVPSNKGILPENFNLLVSNGIFSLYPACPSVYSTIEYMKIFIKNLYAIYQLVEKPQTVYTYWPGVVENSIRDLKEQNAELAKIGRSGGLHPYGITSYSIYADKFKSENALKFTENAERIIAGKYNPNYVNAKGSRGIFGGGGTVEPVHFLYDYCEWAIYAEYFGSENVKSMFVDTADVIMDLGRGVDYIFTFRVNVYNSAPIEDGGYQFEAVGQYIFIMLYYYKFTDNIEFLNEAKRAAEALLNMGFEFSYEFFATPIGALALLRLYEITGDLRYLEGSYIPLATILRDSWLFNPDFRWGVQNYENRIIFLLTSARPNLSYANGWEEQALIKYLYLYLKEGRDVLMPEAAQLTSELLRYKGTSARDSLAPFHTDKSNIYTGIPREWSLPVNPNWFIPLEGFGISRVDEKLGAISQPPYCAGMLPELALLQFHPIGNDLFIYTDAPAEVLQKNNQITFRLLALEGSYRCGLGGEVSSLFQVKTDSGEDVVMMYDSSSGLRVFSAEAGKMYVLSRTPLSLYPPDGTIVSRNQPTFRWEMPSGATGARLLIASDREFDNLVVDVMLEAGETSYTPLPLTDGEYWWKIILFGDFGEIISSIYSIIIDTTPPVVYLTQTPPDVTYDNLLVYAGEARDNTTYVVAIEYSIDNGDWISIENITPAQSISFTFSAEVDIGFHRISVRGRDTAGNVSQTVEHLVEVQVVPVPRFIVENLRLSKENVRVGEQVTIFVDIANIGTASGEYTIVLKVNGEVKDNRKVTLEAGQRRTITFQLQLNEIGEHIISVDGLTAAISVIKTEMPTSTIPTVIIVSIIIGLVAVFTVLKFVVLPKIFG